MSKLDGNEIAQYFESILEFGDTILNFVWTSEGDPEIKHGVPIQIRDCSEDSDADCAGADIDADGICNGPDSIEYPNCRYTDVKGVCEYPLRNSWQRVSSCRPCRTVNHLCTAAGMKKAVSPVLTSLMSALRKKQLITALRQIIASGSVLTHPVCCLYNNYRATIILLCRKNLRRVFRRSRTIKIFP